jgi:hypothetical protein
VIHLVPNRRYRFLLTDSRSVEGELRSLDFPKGYGIANPDGHHSIWVTDRAMEWFLAPGQIEAVEEVRG